MYRHLLLLTIVAVYTSPLALAAPEEFVGPFQTWTNVGTEFGAAGDGVQDDTDALQRAIDSIDREDPIVWIPAGTYRVTRTLDFTRRIGENSFGIIGEDPRTTRIRWDGAEDGTMFHTHNINLSR